MLLEAREKMPLGQAGEEGCSGTQTVREPERRGFAPCYRLVVHERRVESPVDKWGEVPEERKVVASEVGGPW